MASHTIIHAFSPFKSNARETWRMIPTERYFRITDNSNEISCYTEKDGTLT